MLDFLLDRFFVSHEPPLEACKRCKCFPPNHMKGDSIFSSRKTLMPEHNFDRMCIYEPTDRGGCANFKHIINSRSFFIDSFRDSVTPKLGSVVVCDLRLFFLPGVDHSGIVTDSGLILHMDGEMGISLSTPREFINRLDGKNGALSIYVACHGYDAIGNEEAYQRAETAYREDPHFDDYNLFTNNCHQFVQYCLTGTRDHSFTFSALESELCQYHGMDNWRKWDVKLYED